MGKKMKNARKGARKARREGRKAAREERTSARREGRKARREARNDARDEIKNARKDAAEDRTEARQKKRSQVKDIRASGLSGKDKKDALKDARQEKRREVKEAGQDKKDTVKEARQSRKGARAGARDTKKDARAGARAKKKAGRTRAREIKAEARDEIEQAKEVFELEVRFSFAISLPAKATAAGQAAAQVTVEGWINEAELIYSDSPSLSITPTWNWQVPADVLNKQNFTSRREASKFMDERFDNVVRGSKDDGYLQVLILDYAAIKGNDFNGRAFFPHNVTPFRRKYGLILDMDALKSTFSHELGHVFSLIHTFERYAGTKRNCNKDYTKGSTGEGSTYNAADNTQNVMDYGRKDTRTMVLNECQRERAARQRRLYLTKEGETNYRKLKGGR